jgi:ATP-dependent DNA helicase RecG
LLAPLLAPLDSLRGIGPTVSRLLARAVGGERVLDLLFHLPEGFVDRRARASLRDAVPGSVVTLELEVVRIEPPQNARQPTRAVVRDASGFGELVFFRAFPRAMLEVGARVLASGRIDDRRQLVHPDHLVPVGRAENLPPVEPVWRLTAGLFPGHFRRAFAAALERVPTLPEWHDDALLQRERWPAFAAALRALHQPAEPPGQTPRQRLAYDEVLADQISLALVRRRRRERPGRALAGDGALRTQALEKFGLALTEAQASALAEIDADLGAPRKMLRLLQGDVGSGKTLVALLAMLRAVEAGAQAALMVPTELLAHQHARTLARLSPEPVGLLTGSVKGAARARVLLGLASGSLKLVVGTHALFQDGVAYRDLGLAVIDEQHRFGVEQRVSLGAKGEAADVLVMTATPIPRTLLLTQWGEMDVSRLAQKPPGRGRIRTTLHPLAALDDVCDALGRAIARGDRAYWVCPLVAESELADLAAAEARFATLRERFGARVGLAHGRQETLVREAALADFAAGRVSVLVATTVIEVGVDVPEATVMVVEHAERFGLAQLHQLRGRVGRGRAESFCLLLHDDALNQVAQRRLKLLRDSDDGFRIADEDFRIRGGGDLLGTRQSGARGFRVADPVGDEDLLHMAAQEAALVLERDPRLLSERGARLRLLLRLFGRFEAMETLRSG